MVVKTVVITQSNYIPWRGYFDLIRQADELILLDGVQFTRRDWRNRNMIKTPQGPHWLTIPVRTRGAYHQTIAETYTASQEWAIQHKAVIEANYRKADAFGEISPWLFAQMQEAAAMPRLSDLNRHLLTAVCDKLGITTSMRFCRDVCAADALAAMETTDRLVALCRAAGGTRYLSAPAARAYLEERKFHDAGIEVVWFAYGPYRDYPQPWGPFAAQVSIVDLLLNCGGDAANYLNRAV